MTLYTFLRSIYKILLTHSQESLRDAKFKKATVSTTGQQYDATFQKVEEFKHPGTTLTNQNSIDMI